MIICLWNHRYLHGHEYLISTMDFQYACQYGIPPIKKNELQVIFWETLITLRN